jgi:hypothetical protein
MFTEKHRNYLVLFILLFFNGNQLSVFLFGKFSTIIGISLIMVLIYKKVRFDKKFVYLFLAISATILIIGAFQQIILHFVSVEGLINLILKFYLGGIVLNYLKDKIVFTFFKLIFYLSCISLIFYILVNFLQVPLPYLETGIGKHSYIIYHHTTGSHLYKNGGMFWEPGAHAGILTLCLLINFNHVNYYWDKHRIKLIIIFITLLTTQSTTGYILLFIFLIFYNIQSKNPIVITAILPVVIVTAFYIYNNTDFLKAKIENQIEFTSDQDIGDFSNTRFGSLIFDFYYILKHPFIGNGLHESTRYADHRYLFSGYQGNIVGGANSFSHYLASMGVFFVLGYFYLLRRAAKTQGKLFSFLFLLIIFLNLQGEPWLNYPLYLSLPFIIFPKVQKKKPKEISQSMNIKPQTN